MKRNSIATSSLVVLSLLLATAGAQAQSRAKVPFAFQVGTAHVPAGTYTIKKDLTTNSVMIRNVKTGAAVLALGAPESPSKTTGKLIFRHVGNQYSLTEIWGDAGSPGMGIFAPTRHRELQAASGPADAGNTFEIALY